MNTGAPGGPRSAPDVPVETVIVLPGRAIHLHLGPVIPPVAATLDGALEWIWTRWQTVVEQQGHPVVVRVGLPDGRLEARTVTPGAPPVPNPPRMHNRVIDPRWDYPIPDRDGLLAAALAGQRAGQVAGAAIAAGLLADRLRGELGPHPSAVLALEIQARCATLAGHRGQAAVLYLTAGLARHHLGAPYSAEALDVQQAAAVWLGSPRTEATARTGSLLAHHLLGLCPTGPELLAAVLRRLGDQLPSPQQQFTPPEPPLPSITDLGEIR